MKPEHFVGEIGQKAIIERDGKILMCRGNGEPGWDFPGGRLDVNELPAEGLRRELREELGIEEVEIKRPLYTYAYIPKSGIPRFFVLYECAVLGDVQFSLKEDEIEAVHWVGRDDVEALVAPPEWKDALRTYFK